MIPFAIMNGRIEYQNGKSLEIRILELSPDGFQFRVSSKRAEDTDKMIGIVLHFWEEPLRSYREIRLKDIKITMIRKKDFWVEYYIACKEEAYREAVLLLSKEYLSYIEDRCILSDNELSSSMTSYPAQADDNFFHTLGEQILSWTHDIQESYANHEEMEEIESQLADWQLAISLENPLLIEHYLSMSEEEFKEFYWRGWNLQEHPFAKKRIEGISLGNPYCPHLCPGIDTARKVFEKNRKKDERFRVNLIFPPVSQTTYENMLILLKEAIQFAKQYHFEVVMECNDYGFYQKAKLEMEIDRQKNNGDGKIKVMRGIMMDKRKKDPRQKYLSSDHKRIPVLNVSEDSLSLPFYQTNTATFCTLYALWKYGDRGNQKRVESCQMPCMQNYLLYPKHLDMIGKYNSLLGLSKESMTSSEILQEYQKEGKKWLVINL